MKQHGFVQRDLPPKLDVPLQASATNLSRRPLGCDLLNQVSLSFSHGPWRQCRNWLDAYGLEFRREPGNTNLEGTGACFRYRSRPFIVKGLNSGNPSGRSHGEFNGSRERWELYFSRTLRWWYSSVWCRCRLGSVRHPSEPPNMAFELDIHSLTMKSSSTTYIQLSYKFARFHKYESTTVSWTWNFRQ